MKLLEPITLGAIYLKNRMVMAPMTRSRADNEGNVVPLMSLYYQQRASAGLIISEGLNISKQAIGMPFTPGLYTNEHIKGWTEITKTVHEAGGKIIAQLWHNGRAAHSANKNGERPVAPSAIRIENQKAYTGFGWSEFETPDELTHAEVKQVIADYKQSAINALEAGFDGVELHAAFGYLPNQFLSESSNKRTDEYGGSIEDRSRFILEVMKELIAITGPDRAGIKLSPSILYHGMFDENPVELYAYLLKELNKLPIAYVHLMQPMFPIDEFAQYPKDVVEAFGDLIHKPLIINAGYTRDTAEQIVKDGKAQLVSFGALFLANPDLPERFRVNADLNKPDPEKMYAGGDEKGYTDYPFLK
ncbi:alkene reductase [Flavobacterium sp. AC]|uniref:Alkene reductase n=1 Tax=Flavobacterium azizsancarii TaxID=2961580 RepID=A0ABT4WCJ3_9FLAO|nr:alkene reductase [Flavobacterium azizsancarii]MDA6070266.1 alkene reductase [Flavobacterium azizsancarii]